MYVCKYIYIPRSFENTTIITPPPPPHTTSRFVSSGPIHKILRRRRHSVLEFTHSALHSPAAAAVNGFERNVFFAKTNPIAGTRYVARNLRIDVYIYVLWYYTLSILYYHTRRVFIYVV